jgi:hypothetical protein
MLRLASGFSLSSTLKPGLLWGGAITNALDVVEKARLCYNSTGFISGMLFRPLVP